MAILLVILKIVGIILLIPVCLIILIALLLCVPIKYNAKIRYDDKLTATVDVTYFLRIISLKITYNEKGTRTLLKIFGIRIKKKKPKVNGSDEKSAETTARSDEAKQDVNIQDITNETETQEKDKSTEHVQEKHNKKVTKEKSSVKNKTRKNRKKIEKEKKTISSVIESIKRLLEKYDVKAIISITYRYLKKLIKACLPKWFKMKCQVGFSDPATTGGFLAVVYPIIGIYGLTGNVIIMENMEEPAFKLDTGVKGKLLLIRVVIVISMYLLSKPIRPIVYNYFFRKDDSE